MHHYFAVDNTRREFLVQRGIALNKITVLHNSVDLQRIPPRPAPLPQRPQKALAFTKTAGQIPALREVCNRLGLSFATLGHGTQQPSATPEHDLVQADLVFATGRSALEALCSGAAVVVGDARGLAGLATTANYTELRDLNFGESAFTRPLTVEAVEAEIAKYNRADAQALTAKIRQEADLERLLDKLECFYRQAISSHSRPKRQDLCDGIVDFLSEWRPFRWEESKALHEHRKRLVAYTTRHGKLEVPLWPHYHLGAEIDFRDPHSSRCFMWTGWGETEAWGAWTIGPRAELMLHFDAKPKPRLLILRALVKPFLVENHRQLNVRIWAAGRLVAQWVFHLNDSEPRWRNAPIPMPRKLPLHIAFEIDAPKSPLELGASKDSRELGLGISKLIVSDQYWGWWPGNRPTAPTATP
jgi:hypothetical protein